MNVVNLSDYQQFSNEKMKRTIYSKRHDSSATSTVSNQGRTEGHSHGEQISLSRLEGQGHVCRSVSEKRVLVRAGTCDGREEQA